MLVVHCSDPRYQPHFQEFLRKGLGLTHYALLAVPGGAQPLTLVEYLPKFAWSGWRWMKFLSTIARPERIVLLTHDDCRWYLDNRFVREPAGARAQQIADLRRVRDAAVDRFGRLRVELFYATLAGDHATFEAVE